MRQHQLDQSWQYDLPRTRAYVLALMNFSGAGMCFISGWVSPFAGAPVGFYQIVAVTALVIALLLFWRGATLPRWVLQAFLALFSLQVAVLGVIAVRDVAVISLGPAVIAVSAYVGYFYVSRAVYLQVIWSTGTFAIGAWVAPIRPPLVSVLTVLVTAWALALLLNRMTAELRRRSSTDSLTRVATRAAWVSVAEREVMERGGRAMTVAIIDMDDFKGINDSLGHLAGDLLLKEASAAWRDSIPESALIGRFGGDEFVVLFTGVDSDDAAAWMMRMAQIHPAKWTAGLAQHQPGEALTDLLHRADLDLLERKRSRQNL